MIEANTYGQQIIQNETNIVVSAANQVFGENNADVENWCWDSITGQIYGDGSKVYTYKHTEFVKIFPIKFDSVFSDGRIETKIVQEYKILFEVLDEK